MSDDLRQAIERQLKTLLAPAADLEALRRKALLSTEEASRLYGVSCRTLAGWRCEGRGPRYVQDGKLVRYRHQDLEAYFDANLKRTAG